MKTLPPIITFQEVPDEISLSYQITGCDVGCKSCHSKELWDLNNGVEFSDALYSTQLSRYKSLVTCVLFMGGEWYMAELINKLIKARKEGFKTCLYTGRQNIHPSIKEHLTYLKTGPFVHQRGPITSLTTNQKFILVETGEDLTHLFWK